MIAAVWRIPLALAGLSVLGLTAALAGDKAWDWASWALLGVPLAVIARRWIGRTKKIPARDPPQRRRRSST